MDVSSNIYAEFRNSALLHSPQVLICQPKGEDYLTRTYGETLREVDCLSTHLTTLSLPRGTKIAILSENRYEWIVAYLTLAKEADIVWPLAEGQEEILEKRFSEGRSVLSPRPLPEMATIHLELKKPGVTLQLLWEIYLSPFSS